MGLGHCQSFRRQRRQSADLAFSNQPLVSRILALDNRPARKLRESNVYPQFNAYGNFIEFNVTTMAPYLDGGDAILALLKQAQGVASTATSDGTFKAQFNAWRCPSQRGGFGLIQASTVGDYADYIIGLGYAYFGRTDVWATMHAMNPGQWSNMGDPALLKQLSGRRPDAEQVLMNDLLYTWQNGETWGPNHVKSFSTNQTRAYSGNYLSMSGNNTLFGDGRVAWKPAAEFQLAAMQNGNLSTTVPHTQQFSNSMGFNVW